MDWAETTARLDKKHLRLGIRCDLYKRFYGTTEYVTARNSRAVLDWSNSHAHQSYSQSKKVAMTEFDKSFYISALKQWKKAKNPAVLSRQ